MTKTEERQRLAVPDVFKGIAVLSIIFIHAAMCTGVYNNPACPEMKAVGQAGLFFDVPLFFFLSGWMARYARKDIISTAGRLARLYIPYAIMILFLALCILLFFDEQLTPDIVFRWLTFRDLYSTSLSVVLASMWFMVAYFMVYLTTPVLEKVLASDSAALFLMLLLALANAVFTLDKPLGIVFIYSVVYVRLFFFYLLFYVAGMYCRDRKLTSREFIAMSLGVFALFLLCSSASGFPPDLQGNKFPPSIYYLVASLFSVLLVLYAKNFEGAIAGLVRDNALFRFLSYSGRNVFNLYLYQGFGASIPTLLLPSLWMVFNDWRPYLAFCFAMILAVTYPLAHVFKLVNDYIVNKFILMYNYIIQEVSLKWLVKSKSGTRFLQRLNNYMR